MQADKTPRERVRDKRTGEPGHVIERIGKVRAGEDLEGKWCVPVRFDGGSTRFIRLEDMQTLAAPGDT